MRDAMACCLFTAIEPRLKQYRMLGEAVHSLGSRNYSELFLWGGVGGEVYLVLLLLLLLLFETGSHVASACLEFVM